MIKKSVYNILVAIFVATSCFAESFKISGKVLDENYKPFNYKEMGTCIMVIGTTQGIYIKDSLGKFELTIPGKSAIIKVKSFQKVTREIPVTKDSVNMLVVLKAIKNTVEIIKISEIVQMNQSEISALIRNDSLFDYYDNRSYRNSRIILEQIDISYMFSGCYCCICDYAIEENKILTSGFYPSDYLNPLDNKHIEIDRPHDKYFPIPNGFVNKMLFNPIYR